MPGGIPAQFPGALLVPAFAHCEVSDRLLSINGIGATHHGDLAHRRVALERFLDFARRDIFAPAIDDLAQASLDEQVPVLVEVSQITGPEPAVLE
jgi:hypothetical protein